MLGVHGTFQKEPPHPFHLQNPKLSVAKHSLIALLICNAWSAQEAFVQQAEVPGQAS